MKQFRLSENLVNFRKKFGVTQEVIADFLGVTKASVSKWETGLSMPDIAQLPKLASYYDVSIDELMGYEAQLSLEEIKEYYIGFTKEFAKRPFDEVMEEVRGFTRQYYSCYEVLVQVVVLLLNHYMIVEESRQPDIFNEMVLLCQRVQEKSVDVSLCTDAMVLEAMVELIRGNSERAIQKLEFYRDPRGIKENLEGILVQAYQMSGRMEESLERNQFLIWNHLLGMVGASTQYLMANLNQKDLGERTIERVERVMACYQLEKLHPNTFLQFKYASALFYATWDKDEEALKALEIFTKVSIQFITKELYIHGDNYFDRLDSYLKKIDGYITAPRSEEVILASIVQNLEHPAFARFQNTEELKKMKRSVEEWLR